MKSKIIQACVNRKMVVLTNEPETKNIPQDQQLAIAYDYCRKKGDFVNDFVEILLDGVVNDFVKDDLEIKDIIRELQEPAILTGAPFELIDTKTKQPIQGISTFTNRPMTPVVSSTVKGKGVFGKDLLVQFHDSRGTYRYHFETPELAVQAFDEMSEDSPGRWIWEKMRGHKAGEGITPEKIGPAYFSGKPTIGGTTASQKPYDIAGRTPQIRLPNYEKIAKALREWKMAVKKPPTSGEPITMAEWKDYERQQVYNVLMEEFAKMGITSDFVDDYELCQVRKFDGFFVDDFTKASELSLEECIKSRLAKIKKEHPDLSEEEQLKLAKQRCSSRQDFVIDDTFDPSGMSVDECASKAIPIVKKKYPNKPHDQQVAIAFSWCRKKLGIKEDYTLYGTLTRGGEFIYPEGIRFKDFKQLKKLFPKFTHLPAFDVHKEDELIGYGHNFKIIEPNEEYPDGHIEVPIEIFADIKNDNITTDLKDIPVSLRMYDDSEEIPNTYQNITDLYHIAVSLDKTDIDRCSFGGGKSCRVSLQESKAIDSSIPLGKDIMLGLEPNISQIKLKEDFKTMPDNKDEKTDKDKKTGKDVSSTGAQSDKELFIKSCKDGGHSDAECEATWKAKQTKKTGSDIKPEKKEAPDTHKFDFSDPEIKAQIMNIPELKELFEQTKITSDFVKEKIVEEQKRIEDETVKMKAELTKKLGKEKCDFVDSLDHKGLKNSLKTLELLPEKVDESDIPSETEIYKVLPKQDFIDHMEAGKQERLGSKWNWVPAKQ